ncbi:hypothetical protein JTE90_014136, partial [Oedothorax gibbosus]
MPAARRAGERDEPAGRGAAAGGGAEDFTSVQEVQFLGVIGPLDQKRVCKIKCLNGVGWGPSAPSTR